MNGDNVDTESGKIRESDLDEDDLGEEEFDDDEDEAYIPSKKLQAQPSRVAMVRSISLSSTTSTQQKTTNTLSPLFVPPTDSSSANESKDGYFLMDNEENGFNDPEIAVSVTTSSLQNNDLCKWHGFGRYYLNTFQYPQDKCIVSKCVSEDCYFNKNHVASPDSPLHLVYKCKGCDQDVLHSFLPGRLIPMIYLSKRFGANIANNLKKHFDSQKEKEYCLWHHPDKSTTHSKYAWLYADIRQDEDLDARQLTNNREAYKIGRCRLCGIEMRTDNDFLTCSPMSRTVVRSRSTRSSSSNQPFLLEISKSMSGSSIVSATFSKPLQTNTAITTSATSNESSTETAIEDPLQTNTTATIETPTEAVIGVPAVEPTSASESPSKSVYTLAYERSNSPSVVLARIQNKDGNYENRLVFETQLLHHNNNSTRRSRRTDSVFSESSNIDPPVKEQEDASTSSAQETTTDGALVDKMPSLASSSSSSSSTSGDSLSQPAPAQYEIIDLGPYQEIIRSETWEEHNPSARVAKEILNIEDSIAFYNDRTDNQQLLSKNERIKRKTIELFVMFRLKTTPIHIVDPSGIADLLRIMISFTHTTNGRRIVYHLTTKCIQFMHSRIIDPVDDDTLLRILNIASCHKYVLDEVMVQRLANIRKVIPLEKQQSIPNALVYALFLDSHITSKVKSMLMSAPGVFVRFVIWLFGGEDILSKKDCLGFTIPWLFSLYFWGVEMPASQSESIKNLKGVCDMSNIGTKIDYGEESLQELFMYEHVLSWKQKIFNNTTIQNKTVPLLHLFSDLYETIFRGGLVDYKYNYDSDKDEFNRTNLASFWIRMIMHSTQRTWFKGEAVKFVISQYKQKNPNSDKVEVDAHVHSQLQTNDIFGRNVEWYAKLFYMRKNL
jgi:hypothetical protein